MDSICSRNICLIQNYTALHCRRLYSSKLTTVYLIGVLHFQFLVELLRRMTTCSQKQYYILVGGVTNRTSTLGQIVRREMKQVSLRPGCEQSKLSLYDERFPHHSTTASPHFLLFSATECHQLWREAVRIPDSLRVNGGKA
jgi:hypothetical protein